MSFLIKLRSEIFLQTFGQKRQLPDKNDSLSSLKCTSLYHIHIDSQKIILIEFVFLNFKKLTIDT